MTAESTDFEPVAGFEGVFVRPIITQIENINMGSMTQEQVTEIIQKLGQILQRPAADHGTVAEQPAGSLPNEPVVAEGVDEPELLLRMGSAAYNSGKYEEALGYWKQASTYGAKEPVLCWSSWQQMDSENARQVPTKPGIVEIRATGASESAWVGSGVSLQAYVALRVTDPERRMCPYEKELVKADYILEFRYAVAETRQQARTWKSEYIHEYMDLHDGKTPIGITQIPRRPSA